MNIATKSDFKETLSLRMATTLVAAVIISVFFCRFACAESDTIIIGAFSFGELGPWKSKHFAGTTHYRLVDENSKKVLLAESNSSASGLFRKIRIDLEKTPYLNWSWRVENTLGDVDEKSKAGDDFAARVYVVTSGGWAFWRSRAVNYVWANNSAPGSVWPNPFAGKSAIMVAVRSGNTGIGIWQTEKRDVRADINQLFDKPARYIDAVAIMTDSDNSKRRATAFYGDIYFSKN